MTALCGGGASGPQAGAAAISTVGSGLITYLLERYGYEFLKPLGIFAGVPDLTLSVFCATDPPAIPVFSQAETDALLKLQFGTSPWSTGLSKMGDLIQHMAWYQLCQCTGGGLTPFPVSPGQAAGSAVIVSAPGIPATPCNNVVSPVHTYTTGQNFNRGGPDFKLLGASWVRVTSTLTVNVAPAPPITYSHQFQDIHGANTVVYGYTQTAPSTVVTIYPVPIDGITTEMQTSGLAGAGAGTTGELLQWEVFCGGAYPGVVPQPCCPPDANTLALLQQILTQGTLNQRYRLPFAHIDGAAHSGVTGTGSTAIPQLLGVKVAVTAHPLPDVELPGNPAYVKDLGWVSISEPDGMIQERRLSQLGFVWYPPYMELATQFNYSLNPGVTITWTEVQAEP